MMRLTLRASALRCSKGESLIVLQLALFWVCPSFDSNILLQQEAGLFHVLRIQSDEYVELARLRCPFQLIVEEAQILFINSKGDDFLFAWCQIDFLKILELLDRTTDGGRDVLQVKLHDGSAAAFAGVLHRHAGGQRFAGAHGGG